VVINSATDLSFNGQTLIPFMGFPGPGAYLIWNDIADGFIIPADTTGFATINATFEYAGDSIVIPYILYSSWGSHVDGEIILEQDLILGIVAPSGGEDWAIGEQHTIYFEGSGSVDIQNVIVELQHEPDGPWSTLASNVSFAAGRFDWTVTGPISAHCRIRVSDVANPDFWAVSEEFTVSRDLTWANIGQYSGIVAGGGQELVSLNISSLGLEEGTYVVNVVINNTAGDPITVPVTVVVGDSTSDVPEQMSYFTLGQNYPNPFNPNTTIEFSLAKPGLVQVSIFNLNGRLVKTLHGGELAAGRHCLVWDGTDNSGRGVASGTFFYRLKSEEGTLTRKMVLMK